MYKSSSAGPLLLYPIAGINKRDIEEAVFNAVKKSRNGPSGNNVSYSVFYKELCDDGLLEHPSPPASGDRVSLAGFAAAKESGVVARVSPRLAEVLCDGTILSNTEEIRWMVVKGGDPANYKKCDTLIVLDGLQEPPTGHTGRGNAELQNFRANVGDFIYHFGGTPWKLRDLVQGIIEAKHHGLPATAKGELASYLRGLCEEDDHNTYRGLLHDDQSFFVSTCRKGVLTDFVGGKWSDPGSAKFLRDFFSPRNSWRILLDEALRLLNVRLCPVEGKCAFLGAGSYGRVFRVIVPSGPILALKIVLYGQNNSASAEQVRIMVNNEHNLLRKLQITGAVVTLHNSTEHLCTVVDNGVDLGAAYLMSDIGTEVDPKSCVLAGSLTETGRTAFLALRRLHMNGHMHGDARLANLVRIEGSLKWIDVMKGHQGDISAANIKEDLRQLLDSVDPKIPVPVISDILVSNAVTAYACTRTEADMESMCDEVNRLMSEAST
jgi:hypothetical protein